MNRIRKAVIPAAGFGTRLYPASKVVKKELFPIVDRDGITKPLIQVIIEEAVESGIEEICLVIQEQDRQTFVNYFEGDASPELEHRLSELPWAVKESNQLLLLSRRLSYIIQKEQEGFGHAVYCARDWVGNEPFLLLLGDHVYISNTSIRCAQQLINVFSHFGENICSVIRTSEDMLHLFGTVAGKQVENHPGIYEVFEIKEKPSVEYAERHLQTNNIPIGEYLCFFGQYILMPDVFKSIEYLINNNIRKRGEIQLTDALEIVKKDRGIFYAYETDGSRYDIGTSIGYANTVNAFINKYY